MPTQYYNLPTISQDAVANVPDDMNGLATAVDFALHQVAGNVPDVGTLTVQVNTAQQTATNALSLATENQQDIASAEAEIVEAKSNIQTLQGNVASVSNTASNAQVTASSAQAGVTALNAGLQEFEQMFNLTDISTHNASNFFVSGAEGSITLAQNASGTLFKLYGSYTIPSSANKSKTAVPGLNGYYGIDTGAVVNAVPSNAYLIDTIGTQAQYNSGTTAIETAYSAIVAVGSNGHIYVDVANNQQYNPGRQRRVFFHPCIIFNKSFGDSPIIQE